MLLVARRWKRSTQTCGKRISNDDDEMCACTISFVTHFLRNYDRLSNHFLELQLNGVYGHLLTRITNLVVK